MSWTWTGYDYDAVHRFKDEAFFQTGRNNAEARFWKLKIHEADRRGTNSSINFDKIDENEQSSPEKEEPAAEAKENTTTETNEQVNNSNGNDYKYSYASPSETTADSSLDYRYTYPDPRDRSLSIVSVVNRRDRYTANKDYQYGYNKETVKEEEEEDDEEVGKKKEDEKRTEVPKSESDRNNIINGKGFKSTEAILKNHSHDHVSSRFY